MSTSVTQKFSVTVGSTIYNLTPTNHIVRNKDSSVWLYTERYCNGQGEFTVEVPVE